MSPYIALPFYVCCRDTDILKILKSIGAEPGACQNAYTSADDTVYQFLVPAADTQVLENSFGMFAEFSTRIRSAPISVTQHTIPMWWGQSLSSYRNVPKW